MGAIIKLLWGLICFARLKGMIATAQRLIKLKILIEC
jgi:hypothetical protein